MADTKITALTATTTLADTDILPVVTDPAGTPATKKITKANLKTALTLVKGDVGLGNVDNTSDATKNSAAATLTNKVISGATNTLTVREADLSTSDVTTANVSTSKHGFAPKAPNDATQYLDGTGAWSTPGGGGGGGGGIAPALIRSLTPSTADWSDTSSGGTVANNSGRLSLNSSAGANSYGAVNWLWQDGDTPLWALDSSIACHFEWDFFNQGNDFLGFIGTGYTNPRGDAFYTTNNSNHYGFFLSRSAGGNLVIKATSGNSSNTATQTTVYNDPTTVLGFNLAAVHTVGTDIKFYMNGSLVATHTGNEPDPSTKGRPMHIVINNANTAANTKLIIYGYSYTRYMS